MESADGLNRRQKWKFATQVVQMAEGRFDSHLLQSMMVGLVDPVSVEDVLDIVILGLRRRYRYSDGIIIQIVTTTIVGSPSG